MEKTFEQKRNDELAQARTWKSLRKFCNKYGLPILRYHGGHEIHGNENGSLPLSTHDKEIDKGLLHNVKKQITKLVVKNVVEVCLFLFMVRFVYGLV